VLTRYRVSEGKLVAGDEEPTNVWVYVAPDDAERRFLLDELKLDEHTLNSSLDPDEVSRLELEPEHAAIIVKRPKNYCAEDNFLFRVMSAGLFLFKDRLVVVMPDDAPIIDGKQQLKANSPAGVMLRLLYRTVIHFVEHLRVITMVSDSLEQKLNTAMENRYLLSLFTLEKSLVYYLNAINANAGVIDKLRNNAARIGLNQEQLELLEDLAIENQQCYKQAEIYSNILSSFVSARVSIVNNNLTALMKNLTLITIGLMVPTLVVSAFSMNVAIPLQRHPAAFWIIMCLAATAMAAFMVAWRTIRRL
jgi:magnesium transporter